MKKLAEIFLVAAALCVLTSIASAQQKNAEQMYQQALYDMEAKGDYAKAIESFKQVMIKFPNEKATVAKALLNIGGCYEKLGMSEAWKAYERILKEFKDQPQVVAEARTRLALLKQQADASTVQSKRSNRQIWEDSDANSEGSPSPDGRYLSYKDFLRNSLVIYDMKTKERTYIANPDSSRKDMWIYESVWSPDGKQLAYSMGSDEFYQAEIHLINLDGTGHRTLCTKLDSNFVIWLEDWSRDGKFILVSFCQFYPKSPIVKYADLAVISVDDGSIRIIKRAHTWEWKLSHEMFFSPDSRFIAWSAPTEKGEKTCDVFVTEVNGSRETNISQNPADDIALGWEPNGNRLLFSSDRGGAYNLWAIQIDNGKPLGFPKLIMNNIGKIASMGFTNDGSLYYSAEGPKVRSDDFYTESNIYLTPLDPQTGKILSQTVAATMNNNGFNHLGGWSPDSKQLLYMSYFRNKYNGLRKWFILSREAGSEKEVLHQLGSDSSLERASWFPDGKHLAFCTRMPNKEYGIYKLEIETGQMIPLITSKDTLYYTPSVSPDGKILCFESNLGNVDIYFEPSISSIYSYDIERKERKLLVQRGKDQSFRGFGLSPDGVYLAFALATFSPPKSETMMVMSSSGGEPRIIFQVDTTEFFSNVSTIRWSPDGKYIYFVKMSERETKFELFRVPVQGGTPESTGLVKEGLHWFSIRPDGKEIAFCAVIESKTGIWVLENVFNEKEEVDNGKK